MSTLDNIFITIYTLPVQIFSDIHDFFNLGMCVFC